MQYVSFTFEPLNYTRFFFNTCNNEIKFACLHNPTQKAILFLKNKFLNKTVMYFLMLCIKLYQTYGEMKIMHIRVKWELYKRILKFTWQKFFPPATKIAFERTLSCKMEFLPTLRILRFVSKVYMLVKIFLMLPFFNTPSGLIYFFNNVNSYDSFLWGYFEKW